MKAFEEVASRPGRERQYRPGERARFGTNSRTGRFFVASDINATPMSAAAPTARMAGEAMRAVLRAEAALARNVRAAISLFLPAGGVRHRYGGPGKFRGAPALHYRRRMLDPVRAIVYNQGWRHPMQGYNGGHAGAGNYLFCNSGAPEELTVTDACYDVKIGKDRVIFAQSGGRWRRGEPLKRAVTQVAEDVRNDDMCRRRRGAAGLCRRARRRDPRHRSQGDRGASRRPPRRGLRRMTQPADIIIRGGVVVTMDRAAPPAARRRRRVCADNASSRSAKAQRSKPVRRQANPLAAPTSSSSRADRLPQPSGPFPFEGHDRRHALPRALARPGVALMRRACRRARRKLVASTGTFLEMIRHGTTCFAIRELSSPRPWRGPPSRPAFAASWRA